MRSKSLPWFAVPAIALLIAAVLGAIFYLNFKPDRPTRTDSIVLAYAPFEQVTLLWVAQQRHFFEKNGLKVTLREYDTGAGSLDGMLNGEADVTVGVTEFPTVGRVLQKKRVRVIAGIAKLDQIYLVGRKDRGINDISDLKGKRIGTTVGTIAEFYLGRFLSLNGLNMRDITLVDVKTPEGWVNAVADGDIDAIATAQPYANSAKDRLGANARVWPAQSGQPLFGLIISTDRWLAGHPGPVDKLLKSLVQAEDYANNNPAAAKAIVKRKLNMDDRYMDTVWSKNRFSLSLDQSLIVAMEDQARWMRANKLTKEQEVPDFLDYLEEDNLKAVKPEAVNIAR